MIRGSEISTEIFRTEIERRVRSRLTNHMSETVGRARGMHQSTLKHLESTVENLVAASSGVGRIPPAPPTLRGRVGGFLVRVVSRALFWYTPQIHAFQQLTTRLAKHQIAALADL